MATINLITLAFYCFGSDELQDAQPRQLEAKIVQYLSSLSYREGDLYAYLEQVAHGVSQLMGLDWSVVTFYQGEFEKILASTIDIGSDVDQLHPLHGTVTQTVVQTGCPLTIRDVTCDAQYGQTPDGYRAYLGVPLRAPTGQILGTICSFNQAPRSFSPEEVRYAELFAERAATALDNYQMYQQQIHFNERLEEEVARRTAELKDAQAQLIEKERLAAIGEFTSMIVHEIRNPLTTIGLGLNALGRLDLSEVDRLRLNLASEEEARLKALLNEILQYAKPQVLDASHLDFNVLVQETVKTLMAQPAINMHQVSLSLAPSEQRVNGDRDKLKQVLINLITNACEAVQAHDTVTITVIDAVMHPQRSAVQLQVHNGGEPIPPEVLPKLTQPFFSTKSSGNGLGLAIVQRIVDAHQGMMSIESSAGSGTSIFVTLPTVPSPS